MPFKTFEKCIRAMCARHGLEIYEIKNVRDKYDPDRGRYIAKLANGYTVYGNSIATSVEFRNRNHRFQTTIAGLQAAM